MSRPPACAVDGGLRREPYAHAPQARPPARAAAAGLVVPRHAVRRSMTTTDLFALVVATLGGTAVGVERQWSGHAEGPSARFAGIRTFTMLGALAGLAGWMWMAGFAVLAALLVAGAVGIVVAGYAAASRQNVDGTTEMAALIVLAAGILAGTGMERLASGIIAITVLLLIEKSRLHAAVRRIDDVKLRAAVRFGVMAFVILPLLPEGPYGPFGGIRPREIWMLVLFFSGISFLGHVLRDLVGAGHGYFISGLVGGLVSSTNVTFTFARSSRSEPGHEAALAFGAVAANAVLYFRVVAATAVLNADLVPPLVPYVVAPAAVAVVAAAFGAMRSHPNGSSGSPDAERRPLQLVSALQMAVLFQFVIIIVNIARQTWGRAGVVTTAAVLGLTDVDALTVSMARGAAQAGSLQTAAMAIAVGVLANTALKTGIAFVFGAAPFRAITGGALAAMMVAAALSIAALM